MLDMSIDPLVISVTSPSVPVISIVPEEVVSTIEPESIVPSVAAS